MIRSVSRALARWLLCVAACALGCASTIHNRPSPDLPPAPREGNRGSGAIFLALSFSGGGTRAAALAFGVLEELAETRIVVDGMERRLLDEVDVIGSVSGGSFLSAWYGLHGEEALETFPEAVLYRDFDTPLLLRALSPVNWGRGRGEVAARYYDGKLFHGATMGEFRRDGPRIIINATDLVGAAHFSFAPDFFHAICSDLGAFPVASAVAASSAVPGVFSPIVLENFAGRCRSEPPVWIGRTLERSEAEGPSREADRARNFAAYYSDERRYLHLLDGGIAGNQGLSIAPLREQEFGGPAGFVKAMGLEKIRHALLVAVNAGVPVPPEMSQQRNAPSSTSALLDSTTVMVNRQTRNEIDQLRQRMEAWERALALHGMSTRFALAEISFVELHAPAQRRFFQTVPTSLTLEREEIDRLREVGRALLRANPHYQDLLRDYQGTPIHDAPR